MAILSNDMRRMLRDHPDIAVKLLAALSRRLRETNERLTRQSFQTVQSRVASVLAELVAAARSEGAGETDVLITATQADSPSWPGPRASRPAASWQCSSEPGSSPRDAGGSPSITRPHWRGMSTDGALDGRAVHGRRGTRPAAWSSTATVRWS